MYISVFKNKITKGELAEDLYKNIQLVYCFKVGPDLTSFDDLFFPEELSTHVDIFISCFALIVSTT